MNKRSGFTLIELFTVLAICFILLALIFSAGGAAVLGTSDGKRIGVITKFSYKGIFFKSYEGELNMGGIRNSIDGNGNHSVVANVWQFSCTNPQMAKKLDELVGKEVIIKYHQSFGGLSRNTSYDVVNVEEVKSGKPVP